VLHWLLAGGIVKTEHKLHGCNQYGQDAVCPRCAYLWIVRVLPLIMIEYYEHGTSKRFHGIVDRRRNLHAGTLALAWKYHDDFRQGVLANALCGGDNCHRGVVVGALLGAANPLPDDWKEQLHVETN
jgi:hypothetical protein